MIYFILGLIVGALTHKLLSKRKNSDTKDQSHLAPYKIEK